jgi:hypothetical protein
LIASIMQSARVQAERSVAMRIVAPAASAKSNG